VIGFVRTRLSRRLFMLFMLSAFLPLAALAVLSLTQVRSLLLQQGDARLGAIAKSYGMTLFERLLLASDVATAAANRGVNPAVDDTLARRTFNWIAIMRDGKVVPVMGRPDVPAVSDVERGHLAAGKTAVIIPDESHPRIVIAAPLDPGAGALALGELRPDYIWGPADELPTATEFCVIEDTTLRALYCSAPPAPPAIAAAEAASHASFGAADFKLEGEA